jgi:hypothetical protein
MYLLKNFISVIEDKIKNNIEEGLNIFEFDFKNFEHLPIRFFLNIYLSSTQNDNTYGGGVSPSNMSNTKFDGFIIRINIDDDIIDYIRS